MSWWVILQHSTGALRRREVTMAEVLVEFSEAVAGTDGITYTARACAPVGPRAVGGMGGIYPTGGGDTVRSGRETPSQNGSTRSTGRPPDTIYLEALSNGPSSPCAPRAARGQHPEYVSAARHGDLCAVSGCALGRP